MIVSRPNKCIQSASGDRGQHLTQQVSIKIDRLHCERTTELLDGSLVIIQVLQGVLREAALSNDEVSGTPPGAIRYCPVHLIATLDPGLTIVLFDVKSGRTRAIHVDGRSILRVATIFGVSELHTPVISKSLLCNASEIIRINRVGIDCTGFVLDMNGLKAMAVAREASADSSDDGDASQQQEPVDETVQEKEGVQLRYAGRRQVTMSAAKRRLLQAKALLAKKNIPLNLFGKGESRDRLRELRSGVSSRVKLV